ncbi:MAG: extensin family protein [Cypionkella sp.]
MARRTRPRSPSAPAPIGAFDHAAFAILLAGALVLAGKGWLDAHPQHDPWAPLDLRDPPGWATERKLRALRGDAATCRDVLARSEVAFTALPPAGEGDCARADRTVLADVPLAPARPATTCPVAVGLELWLRQTVQPAARALLGSPLARIEHFGAYSCRRMYGRSEGSWSEHATGNAIDVAAFVLADGTQVSVLEDWRGEGARAIFLRRVRDGGCDAFGTVLSPDYNAAHRDHLHLDQQARGFGGVCR